MPPSPTGPLKGTSVTSSDGTSSWTNPSAVTASGTGSATAPLTDGIGFLTPTINPSAFNFTIPHTAIIDGIEVTVVHGGNGAISDNAHCIVNNNSKSGSTKSTIIGTTTTSVFGGATDLWGQTWTYSDINDSSFGAQMTYSATHDPGDAGNISVSSIQITIYWHTAPTEIPRQKYYIYKVYDKNNNFLGCLPNVISPYQSSQDINTAGSQINIQCAISADSSGLNTDTLTDEAGNILTDESNNILTDEGTTNYVGTGDSNAIIRNGVTVVVYEYGYYYPNGYVKFRGVVDRNTSKYGGDDNDDTVTLVVYSEGYDMDNHLVRGSPFNYTADQTQSSENASDVLVNYGSGAKSLGAYIDGQTFTAGVGVTNVGAIRVMLNGTATCTMTLYDSPITLNVLATVTQSVSVSTATDVRFTFPVHAKVTAGSQYFFTVTPASGESISIYYQNSNVYSGGNLYQTQSVGWGSVGLVSNLNADLYFVTESTTGSLTATFSDQDPSTGMLTTIVDDYNAEGGKVTYTSDSIQSTGLSLTYTFNTNTTYEGTQACLSISPNGFYYYIDLGTSILNFKQASTTADIVLTKGKHMNSIQIVASTEYIVNTAYVVGGVVAGSNIFTVDQDSTSVSLYGQRIARHTDNRITDTTTAHAVGGSMVDAQAGEQYQTQATIIDRTMDINLLKPGLIIGFNGFGTYVDSLLAQLVHVDQSPDSATIQLGILPKRQAVSIEQINRGLIASQTIANPTSPS